jgi:hypothetical protein
MFVHTDRSLSCGKGHKALRTTDFDPGNFWVILPKRKIMETDWSLLWCITRRNANTSKMQVMLQWHILFCFSKFEEENAILRSALDYFHFVCEESVKMHNAEWS